MSDGNRIPIAEAEALADEIVQVLKPVCQRVEIAGSIRRRKETIGDIEIVCIPKERQIGLFGETVRDATAIYNALYAAKYKLTKGGDKYAACTKDGIKYDVFITTKEAWGCIFMIRTGSAKFVKKMMIQRRMYGYCDNMRFADGRLWRNWVVLDTPEEEDVFREMGLAFVPPEERDL